MALRWQRDDQPNRHALVTTSGRSTPAKSASAGAPPLQPGPAHGGNLQARGRQRPTVIIRAMLRADPHWDALVAAHPAGHLLQTTAWGRLKAEFGWQPRSCAPRPARAAPWCFPAAAAGPEPGLRAARARWPIGRSPARLPRWCPRSTGPSGARAPSASSGSPSCPTSPAGHAELLAGLGFRPSPHTVQPPRAPGGRPAPAPRPKSWPHETEDPLQHWAGRARKASPPARPAAPADLEALHGAHGR